MNTEAPKTVETIETLTRGAKVQQDIVTAIDEQIAGLQKKRAEHSKKLRSLTSKIVTLEIKGVK